MAKHSLRRVTGSRHGRGTSGVRGIMLKGEATMLGMELQTATVTSLLLPKGYGKRTAVSEYPEHKRGGQGVFTITMTAKKGSWLHVVWSDRMKS